ncbi:MAG: stage II sporulation protein M [Dehalococcoidia bacterium]|nr:stage II sporulation protein M [Dehalococcoidia bacterium]
MFRFLSSPLGRMFLLSLALYVLSTLVGYEASTAQGNSATSSASLQALAQLFAPLAAMEPPLMMVVIFLNNSIKAFVVIALGFTFGVIPFIFLTVNGLITGLVLGMVGSLAGPRLALAALAPHGVIEIPALLLASALGFMVARAVVRRIAGREARLGHEFKNSMGLYLKVVLPALFVAAAVEAFVTPIFIGK